jgi:hypothetical protein
MLIISSVHVCSSVITNLSLNAGQQKVNNDVDLSLVETTDRLSIIDNNNGVSEMKQTMPFFDCYHIFVQVDDQSIVMTDQHFSLVPDTLSTVSSQYPYEQQHSSHLSTTSSMSELMAASALQNHPYLSSTIQHINPETNSSAFVPFNALNHYQ